LVGACGTWGRGGEGTWMGRMDRMNPAPRGRGNAGKHHVARRVVDRMNPDPRGRGMGRSAGVCTRQQD
jgi:hypothetical protein